MRLGCTMIDLMSPSLESSVNSRNRITLYTLDKGLIEGSLSFSHLTAATVGLDDCLSIFSLSADSCSQWLHGVIECCITDCANNRVWLKNGLQVRASCRTSLKSASLVLRNHHRPSNKSTVWALVPLLALTLAAFVTILTLAMTIDKRLKSLVVSSCNQENIYIYSKS